MSAPDDNRLDRKFRELKAQGQKAFVAYITAGDPSPKATPELVWALERAGADVVELGMPFSDPLADGVVNQLSAQRALAAGTTPGACSTSCAPSACSRRFPSFSTPTSTCSTPMGSSASASRPTRPAWTACSSSTCRRRRTSRRWPHLRRISLVAPTSPPERIALIVQKAGGFVYYVSREGVTGMQATVSGQSGGRIELIRKHTALPICIGFGISTPEQARTVAQQADGAVIGSALVNQIATLGNDPELAAKLEAFARPLAEAIHS